VLVGLPPHNSDFPSQHQPLRSFPSLCLRLNLQTSISQSPCHTERRQPISFRPLSARSRCVPESIPLQNMSPHPHLHPRSRFTSSLFGTTLLVSFLVVAMPHILPCPAPRVAYADAEGQVDRRRRDRSKSADGEIEPAGSANGRSEKGMGMTDQELARMVTEREEIRKKGRECPVPKPGGWVGEWFGWKSGAGKEGR